MNYANSEFDLFDHETKSKVTVQAIKKGKTWMALCPKHADKNPSLSINEKEKVFHCFACDFSGTLYDPSKANAKSGEETQRKIAATYDYKDRTGNILFQTVRYEPKGFSQRRPDGSGGWTWNLKGIQTVLYRLPDVLNAQEILILEGEKDADNVAALGFCATTSPMGAGKWRDHYNPFLKGKDLILCPDNDPQGREHMNQVATSLKGTARGLKWLDLPDLPEKGDISDWIATFQDPDEARERLAILIENAAPYTSPEDQRVSYANLHLPSSLEISQLEIKVDWIVKNLIPKESITLLHSIGGVGKSYLTYGIAKAVADAELFFGLDVIRIPTFYIDYENPLSEIVDRMKKTGGSENLKIWHLSHDPAPIRFDTDQWEIYKSFPPGLFIIDSLRSSHLLEENSSKDAAFIMARLKEIRALGNTIILIHHENKVGGYRGSTAWFDLSDHILKFSRVKSIGSDEDAEEDNFDLPIRLGLGGKSRFSSAMDLKPMYFKFKEHRLCSAEDPEEEPLNKMADLLDPAYPPNQSEFQKLVKQNLGIGAKDFRKLLKRGESLHFWFSEKSKTGNKLEYFRGVK
jgi:hypothetical protein